jgi:hypothetical protein
VTGGSTYVSVGSSAAGSAVNEPPLAMAGEAVAA